MLHDDNDHFWRMYNDEHDYEYFQEHQDDCQRSRGRRHPIYWAVVFIVTVILGMVFPTSPGVWIFFLLFAISGSTML